MNKPSELLPLGLFFITYLLYGFITATQVLVFTTAMLFLSSYVKSPKPLKSYASQLLVIGLGGLSLLTHNPMFLVWKPTVMYLITALAIVGSQFIYKQSLIEKLFNKAEVTPTGYPWFRLDTIIASIFTLLAIINIQVYQYLGLEKWVQFKFLSLIFVMIIIMGISAHVVSYCKSHESA